MAKSRIRTTESEYADVTFHVDDNDPFTLTLDQQCRLRVWLTRHLPAVTKSRVNHLKRVWREIKASKYQKRFTLRKDWDGTDTFLLMDMPTSAVLIFPTPREIISAIPAVDRKRARKYFLDQGVPEDHLPAIAIDAHHTSDA